MNGTISFEISVSNGDYDIVNHITEDLFDVFAAMLKLHLRDVANIPQSTWKAARPTTEGTDSQ